MLGIVVHPANVQDRDGAEELLRRTRRLFPFVEVIFADGGYQGPVMAAVTAKTGRWRVEIIKRNDVPRFEVIPAKAVEQVRKRRWVSGLTRWRYRESIRNPAMLRFHQTVLWRDKYAGRPS